VELKDKRMVIGKFLRSIEFECASHPGCHNCPFDGENGCDFSGDPRDWSPVQIETAWELSNE